MALYRLFIHCVQVSAKTDHDVHVKSGVHCQHDMVTVEFHTHANLPFFALQMDGPLDPVRE